MEWRKSSACKADQPMCVEVKELPSGTRLIRNNSVPGQITATAEEWSAFIAGVKTGEFD